MFFIFFFLQKKFHINQFSTVRSGPVKMGIVFFLHAWHFVIGFVVVFFYFELWIWFSIGGWRDELVQRGTAFEWLALVAPYNYIMRQFICISPTAPVMIVTIWDSTERTKIYFEMCNCNGITTWLDLASQHMRPFSSSIRILISRQ